MVRVEVAKLPVERSSNSKRQLYAMICYYYPQYDLQQASRLPARDIALLLKTARKMDARKMYNLTQIAAAPHSKKGTAVKKLADYFSKESRL